jgi:hypothetical protein
MSSNLISYLLEDQKFLAVLANIHKTTYTNIRVHVLANIHKTDGSDPQYHQPVRVEKSMNGSASATQHKEERQQFLHCLRFAGNGDEINRGRTVWRKLAR